jgi:hypothetical protein
VWNFSPENSAGGIAEGTGHVFSTGTLFIMLPVFWFVAFTWPGTLLGSVLEVHYTVEQQMSEMLEGKSASWWGRSEHPLAT